MCRVCAVIVPSNNMWTQFNVNICLFEDSEDRIPGDGKSINLYKSLYFLLAFVDDGDLEDALIRNVQKRCQDEELVFKRSSGSEEKVVGKKIKFHSWGGKRSNEAVLTPKLVNRATFHSWGGKRSQASAPDALD